MGSSVANSKGPRARYSEATIHNVQVIQAANRSLLFGGMFPALASLPNINYLTMANWMLESSLHLLVNPKNTSIWTARKTFYEAGGLARLFNASPNVQAMRASPSTTPAQKDAIYDGYYFFGLTCASGSYFIKDTKANQNLAAYKPLMAGLAAKGFPVEVPLGTSMDTLFSGNNVNAITSSLAQGLIILNDAYLHQGLNKFPSDKSKAILWALGAYLGPKRDSNNQTGLDRIAAIAEQTGVGVNLNILAQAGIYPNDSTSLYNLGVQVASLQQPSSHMIASTGTSSSKIRVASTTTPVPTGGNTNPNCT